MDDKIVIKGVPPYDGEYLIDLETLTMGELHTVKRMAGVTSGELGHALVRGDSDVVVAFTKIVIERTGKDCDEDRLWGAKAGCIVMEFADREEEDADPPAEAASEPPTNSGESSEPTSDENPETDPRSTGTPD